MTVLHTGKWKLDVFWHEWAWYKKSGVGTVVWYEFGPFMLTIYA